MSVSGLGDRGSLVRPEMLNLVRPKTCAGLIRPLAASRYPPNLLTVQGGRGGVPQRLTDRESRSRPGCLTLVPLKFAESLLSPINLRILSNEFTVATAAPSTSPLEDSGNRCHTGPLATAAPRAVIDMGRIQALATRAGSMVEQIRSRLLAPEARKIAPLYSASQIAAVRRRQAHVNYRISKGDLPSRQVDPNRETREFTLTEARQWARVYRSRRCAPLGNHHA